MREVFDLVAALVVLGGDVAKTFRCEDFEDDGTITEEHQRKRNDCTQHEVDPVPWSHEKRHKLPTSLHNERQRERKELIDHSESHRR